MFSLAVIAGIIVFGGLFAFLGDRVGMKVGKKRLSIFGLRPKYTSMIITVLTGFFIAGLTLLVLTMLSAYVRTAIFNLRTLEKELQVTTGKVKHLTVEVTQKAIEYQLLNLKYGELRRNLDDVVKQRKQVEAQLEDTQKQYRDTLKQYQEAAATLTNTQTNLKNTKQDLDLAQNRLKNLTKINDDLKQQITGLTLQEARLNQQIQNLEGSLKSLEDRNQKIVDKPVLFYVGEILVAKIVDPASGASSDKVFNDVIEPLLKNANEVALKRGARIPGKSDYALRVAPQRVAEVCSKITGLSSKAVLRVVIDKNSVVGEPAIVDLEIYPNQLLFKNGEVIVEAVVSGGTTESELRDQLLSLLLRGHAKAIEKGIFTGKQNLRDLVSVSDIAKIIKTIKTHGEGKHKVSLMAAGDVFRIDSLKVKFEVNDI